MPEPALLASLAPAACGVLLALAAAPSGRRPVAAEWLRRRSMSSLPAAAREGVEAMPLAAARGWLGLRLEAAGWRREPAEFLLLAGLLGVGTGLAGLLLGILAGSPAAALALAVSAGLAGPAVALVRLLSAARARTDRLNAEVPVVLDLVTLELSSGASAAAALGRVLARLECDLADDLNRLLIAAQLSTTQPFDGALTAYAERRGMPALATLAGILAAGREYGAGVQPGVRALALDQRRAQRRAVIAAGRRCLNRVLIPAAVGVLLPFMAILLFPAVATLAVSLH